MTLELHTPIGSLDIEVVDPTTLKVTGTVRLFQRANYTLELTVHLHALGWYRDTLEELVLVRVGADTEGSFPDRNEALSVLVPAINKWAEGPGTALVDASG